MSLVKELLLEREGYINRNLPERAAAVALQLRKLGIVVTDEAPYVHEVETATATPKAERAVRPKAVKRTKKS